MILDRILEVLSLEYTDLNPAHFVEEEGEAQKG